MLGLRLRIPDIGQGDFLLRAEGTLHQELDKSR